MNKIVIVSVAVLVGFVVLLGSVAQGNIANAQGNTSKAIVGKTFCDRGGVSETWVDGCKNGWYDHNHCRAYTPLTGDYAKGYKVGWAKGVCKK